MTTTEPKTALECAFALVDATGIHGALISHPNVTAAYEAMKPHRDGYETVTDAALRIIAEDHRRQARTHAETSAMCGRLQLKLTAALEAVRDQHERARIQTI